MPTDISVPTCISGTVSQLPPISHCMDGATHQLHTFVKEPVRLMGHTEAVTQQLQEAAQSHEVVTVCGYWIGGPECSYLDTFAVGAAEDFVRNVAKPLFDGSLAWPGVP